MSKPNRPHGKTLVLAAAAVVLMASFGVGRLVARQDADASATPDASIVEPKPATRRPSAAEEPERYKVPISVSQPMRGAPDALVSIVEWCDLRGEACRESDELIRSLLREYDGRLRHGFRHFPGQASTESMLSHEFARIAHEQADMFWQVRAALLASDEPLTTERLKAIAASLELDWAPFETALKAHNHAGYVGADAMFAGKFSVTESPTFFVNGVRFRGEPSRARLKKLIDEELAYAGKLVAEGTPRDQLYKTIIESGLWEAPSPAAPTAQ